MQFKKKIITGLPLAISILVILLLIYIPPGSLLVKAYTFQYCDYCEIIFVLMFIIFMCVISFYKNDYLGNKKINLFIFSAMGYLLSFISISYGVTMGMIDRGYFVSVDNIIQSLPKLITTYLSIILIPLPFIHMIFGLITGIVFLKLQETIIKLKPRPE